MKSNFFISLAIYSTLPLAMAGPNFTPDEQGEILRAHNRWRSAENVSALHWSSALADNAQDYADTLKKGEACEPKHSQSTDFGENLFWASPIIFSDGTAEVQRLTPTDVIDDWGSEKVNYWYATNTCAAGKMCGHFTQIVWKSTTEVGCGKAICPDNSQVWVCNYNPPGNFIGQKPY